MSGSKRRVRSAVLAGTLAFGLVGAEVAVQVLAPATALAKNKQNASGGNANSGKGGNGGKGGSGGNAGDGGNANCKVKDGKTKNQSSFVTGDTNFNNCAAGNGGSGGNGGNGGNGGDSGDGGIGGNGGTTVLVP